MTEEKSYMAGLKEMAKNLAVSKVLVENADPVLVVGVFDTPLDEYLNMVESGGISAIPSYSTIKKADDLEKEDRDTKIADLEAILNNSIGDGDDKATLEWAIAKLKG